MDVVGWLRRLGLEQYGAAFRENNVDGSILPSLTMEDLKEVGVGSVGHRRKLLDAVGFVWAVTLRLRPLESALTRCRRIITITACPRIGRLTRSSCCAR